MDELDLKTGKITYLAIPFPMPPAWQLEFIKAFTNHRGDSQYLTALEARARAALGVIHTRPAIVGGMTLSWG